MKIKRLLSVFLLSVAMAFVPSVFAASNTFTAKQKKAIEKVVHDYLLKNPEILIQVSQELQKRELVALQKNAQKAIVENAKELFHNPNSPVAGNPKGNVTMVEFFDYQCVHCRNMAPVVDKLIKKNPNLRVVYKDFPIMGPDSQLAAIAAIAVQRVAPKKFIPFHHSLMHAKRPLDQAKIMSVAKKVGIDTAKLKAFLQNKDEQVKIQKQLQGDFKLAQALGVRGTPTFVISNSKLNAVTEANVSFVPGETTYGNLQTMINKAKKR